jgi:two-component system, LytTR family, response regulator
MNIKTLIVDDERLARAELKRLLEHQANYDLLEAATFAEAVEMINTHTPDLVFLDIQLDGKKTGFDVLEQLEYTPKVIFCTAYDEFAVKAFEQNALDYLMKPVDPQRLEEALHKYQAAVVQKANNKKLQILTEDDQVFVKDGDRCWFITLSDIRLFESAGNYTKVYFGDNKPLVLRSLNALEEKLDEKSFFRANRKHIINLRWIKGIEPYLNGGFMVTLRGNEEIEVSRRQAVKFKDMMSL